MSPYELAFSIPEHIPSGKPTSVAMTVIGPLQDEFSVRFRYTRQYPSMDWFGTGLDAESKFNGTYEYALPAQGDPGPLYYQGFFDGRGAWDRDGMSLYVVYPSLALEEEIPSVEVVHDDGGNGGGLIVKPIW